MTHPMNKNRGSLANALNCIAKGYRRALIGRVTADFSSYKIGDFVLFEKCESGNLVVEMPMSPESIDEELASGSLLMTFLPIVGVPAKYVEPVLENAK